MLQGYVVFIIVITYVFILLVRFKVDPEVVIYLKLPSNEQHRCYEGRDLIYKEQDLRYKEQNLILYKEQGLRYEEVDSKYKKILYDTLHREVIKSQTWKGRNMFRTRDKSNPFTATEDWEFLLEVFVYS